MELTCTPGSIQSARQTGEKLLVAHNTMSAPRTACCGEGLASIAMPVRSAMSQAKATRFSAFVL